MALMLNPFDAAGYSVAEMTNAINLIPNIWGRVNQLGLFEPEPISTTVVLMEEEAGVVNVLPALPRGAPASVGSRATRRMRSFVVPHHPHDDIVLPEEVQNIRMLGEADMMETVDRLAQRKLTRLRQKHAYTLEWLRLQSLKGLLKDGNGTTLYNWFSEFGVTQLSVDFVLGTGTTDIDGKVAAILRQMEVEARGEVFTGAHCLVSPAFFDKLIAHQRVREAYMHFSNSAGGQPLREDVRRRFPYKGVVFEEYNATFTLANGTTEAAFPAGEGIAFPLGTTDTFRTYFGPANFIETVGVPGVEVYAKQVLRQDGRAIDIMSESNPLPVVRRPAMLVRVFTSN